MKLASAKPRLVIVALCALIGPLAHAQDNPALAAPSAPSSMKEVQVADKAFTRGGAVPDWVETVAIPERERKDAVVVRLADTQFRVGDPSAVYVHRAVQSNDPSTLKKIGEFSTPFVPEYQHLSLHSVAIWRDGVRLDRTPSANVRFMQPATEFVNSVYTSSVVAAVLVDDVRVGDTLEFAYTISGSNPVFGGKYFDSAFWDSDDPVDLRRVVLTSPQSRSISWKSIGDTGTSVPRPTVSTAGGMRKMVFEQHALDAISIDPLIPNSYAPGRWIQFSEFQDWSEVSGWASELFAPKTAGSEEFAALVQRLRQGPGAEAQLADALQFTQREIRYFSLSFGESSHRPTDPDVVLKRRFGDCKDKSYLLITLLRALGIEAHPALLSSTRKARYDQLLPSPQVFDHVIVQARIGDKVYFVDPTLFEQKGRIDRIGQGHQGSEVLVVAEGTRETTTVPLSPEELNTSERRDEAVLHAFDGDGELVSKQWYTGMRAAVMRTVFGRIDRKMIEKEITGSYDKQYPGATMIGPLQVEDDAELNRIVTTARIRLPGYARKVGDSWVIAFRPDNLIGVINGQVSSKRTMPLLIQAFPFVGHYVYQVDLPDEVSAVQDPSTREVSGPYFKFSIRRAFRGNRAEVELTYRALAGEIAAKRVPDYVADARKLNELGGFAVVVGPDSLKKKGFLGIGERSFQATLAARIGESIEKYSATINAAKLGPSDLAHAYCDRGAAQLALGHGEEALRDVNTAVDMAPNDPDILSCRAEIYFGQGDFKRAADQASSAVVMGGGSAGHLRERGLARFYLKRYAEAADDFARAATLETDASARSYNELWAIASYRRGSLAVPAELAERAGANPGGAWPHPALAMLAGRLTPEEMLKQLAGKSGDELIMTQTEAYFYLGEHYLASGDRGKAQEAFEKVRALGVLPYTEYTAAGFELQDLGTH